MDFQYRPLRAPSHMIRLLDLLPRPASPDTLLSCRMRHASLKSTPSPRYETISYVWGDPTPSNTILVNGKELKVPKSAEQALRRLAMPGKTGVVWIDAVCINQMDMEERAQQVALMGKVYASSSRTLIYLGNEEEEIFERVRQEFLNILEQISRAVPEGVGFDSLVKTENDEWVHASEPVEMQLDEDAILCFFYKPWFSRLWVVQEAVLSREARIYWGANEFEFEAMLYVAVWIQVYHSQSRPISFGQCNGLYNCVTIWDFRRTLTLNGAVELGNLLVVARELNATDARDKLYGLLGICGRLPQHQPFETLLVPDYNRPVCDVLRDAVRYAVLTSDDPLWLLRSVTHRSVNALDDQDFPTWVARFDQEPDNDVDPDPLVDFDPDTKPSEREDEDVELARGQNDPRVLRLRGCIVDVITKTSTVFDGKALGDLRAGEVLLDNALHLTKNNPDLRPRLARTLIADTSHLKVCSTQKDLDGLPLIINHLRNHRRIEPVHALPHDADATEVNASAYWQALLEAARNRRVAVTTGGRLALVPKIAESGDLVVLFKESPIPFVIRPRGAEYGLLSECYVDGAMSWQEDPFAASVTARNSEIFALR